MNIQIIGTRKNADTRAAERFFKERGVSYQFVDLTQRRLSAGEIEHIIAAAGTDDLIDTESKSYQKRGLSYMEFDVAEELTTDPLLMRQPIVRNGRSVTIGVDTATWERWIASERL